MPLKPPSLRAEFNDLTHGKPSKLVPKNGDGFGTAIPSVGDLVVFKFEATPTTRTLFPGIIRQLQARTFLIF